MLSDLLKLKEYQNIALVGAGGKTTLINRLTESLRKKSKILISSTTTFIKPAVTMYDFIDDAYHEDYQMDGLTKSGVYIIGKGKNLKNLVFGLSCKEIAVLSPWFDHSIIECDFSNGRPLKGFRDSEPKIPEDTHATIGVLDIQSLGVQVNAKNIHHLDKYLILTGSSIGSLVTIEDLKKIIEDPKALFKNAKGKRILYINKVEKELDQALTKSLVGQLDLTKVDLVVAGSLVLNRYEILYQESF